MKIEPVALEGRHVRMEPLNASHAVDLFQAIQGTPMDFMFSWWGDWGSSVDFEKHLEENLCDQAHLYFALVEKSSGKAIGSSSYMDIRLAHRALEIGATWIGKQWQGTNMNPEMKFLMIRHAFETLGCNRVQLKTDGRNVQSQNAMKKLGLHFEGILRKHLIAMDGFVRDTHMFSVTDEEWPALKSRIIDRLGYDPSV